MPDTLVDTDILRAAVQLACRARRCTTASPGNGLPRVRGCTYTSITAGFFPPPTSRGGRLTSAAAPCSTIYASRWRQPGGLPMSTDFPTPITSIISRHSISARWAASPISIATEPTQFGTGAPTGFPSPHRGTGSRARPNQQRHPMRAIRRPPSDDAVAALLLRILRFLSLRRTLRRVPPPVVRALVLTQSLSACCERPDRPGRCVGVRERFARRGSGRMPESVRC